MEGSAEGVINILRRHTIDPLDLASRHLDLSSAKRLNLSLALALSFAFSKMAVSRLWSLGKHGSSHCKFFPQNTYSLTDRVALKNDKEPGTAIPRFGLGVYVTEPGSETQNAVKWALEAGYRVRPSNELQLAQLQGR